MKKKELLKLNLIIIIIQRYWVDKIYFQNRLIAARYCQCFLMSFTMVIFFGMRTALSVGIIAMTEENPPKDVPSYPEWTNTDTILSSFFWGYMVTQVVAGQLSEYFGAKWFLVGTMLLSSVFNILIPEMAACWGSTGVIVCRVIQGLAQGFLYPCINNIISKWTPVFERCRVSSSLYGGVALGIVTSMPVTGTIAGSELGWPFACYLYGGLGIVWTLIFALFSADSPSTHRWISEDEKAYIEKHTEIDNDVKTKIPTPWKSIFTSLPMWAILVATCGQNFGSFTLMSEIPSFMDNIMNFNIENSSQLSALPYIAVFFVGVTGAPIADILITKHIITIGTARKIFQSLGAFLPAIGLLVLSYISSDQKNLATAILVMAVGTSGFTQSGYLVNPIDLSPNHAGTLIGISNCVGTICSILGPLTVQFLGEDKKNPALWEKVFRISAGIYVGCGIFYVLFSSGETQFWNYPLDSPKRSMRQSNSSSEGENHTEVYVISE